MESISVQVFDDDREDAKAQKRESGVGGWGVGDEGAVQIEMDRGDDGRPRKPGEGTLASTGSAERVPSEEHSERDGEGDGGVDGVDGADRP